MESEAGPKSITAVTATSGIVRRLSALAGTLAASDRSHRDFRNREAVQHRGRSLARRETAVTATSGIVRRFGFRLSRSALHHRSHRDFRNREAELAAGWRVRLDSRVSPVFYIFPPPTPTRP